MPYSLLSAEPLQAPTDNGKVMKHGSRPTTILMDGATHIGYNNLHALSPHSWGKYHSGTRGTRSRREEVCPKTLQSPKRTALLCFDNPYQLLFAQIDFFCVPTVAGTIHHLNGLLKQTGITQSEAATSSMNVKHAVATSTIIYERIQSLMDVHRCSKYV